MYRKVLCIRTSHIYTEMYVNVYESIMYTYSRIYTPKYVNVYLYIHIDTHTHIYVYIWIHTRRTNLSLDMGWLRLVGSLKWYVSFAKEPYKTDNIMQKRPIIIRTLLIVATPYSSQNSYWDCHGSFKEQRLFSVKFARFRNFLDFAQIWGTLESDKLWEFQCWRVADGKDESW